MSANPPPDQAFVQAAIDRYGNAARLAERLRRFDARVTDNAPNVWKNRGLPLKRRLLILRAFEEDDAPRRQEQASVMEKLDAIQRALETLSEQLDAHRRQEHAEPG